jgi:hypothetical protein
VSKDSRAFVSSNACWLEAYAVLDQDFQITSANEFTVDYRPYPDLREDYQPESQESWDDCSLMYRFGKLLDFVQRQVVVFRRVQRR